MKSGEQMSDKCVRYRDMVHHLLRSKPFRIGIVCGIISVLPDIDHIIAYYWLKGLDGRFLHTPLLIWAGTLIIIMCAYITGLYIKLVLKKQLC